MKQLLARPTTQAKALSWAITHLYSWGRAERQRDVLQLMEPIPQPTHREHRELWTCSGAPRHETDPEGKAVPELEGCPQQNSKKSPRKHHKTWDSSLLGLVSNGFQWLWQDSVTASRTLQAGSAWSGDACLNSSPSNLFYLLNFVFCCSSPADKLESPTCSPVPPHC